MGNFIIIISSSYNSTVGTPQLSVDHHHHNRQKLLQCIHGKTLDYSSIDNQGLWDDNILYTNIK